MNVSFTAHLSWTATIDLVQRWTEHLWQYELVDRWGFWSHMDNTSSSSTERTNKQITQRFSWVVLIYVFLSMLKKTNKQKNKIKQQKISSVCSEIYQWNNVHRCNFAPCTIACWTNCVTQNQYGPDESWWLKFPPLLRVKWGFGPAGQQPEGVNFALVTDQGRKLCFDKS